MSKIAAVLNVLADTPAGTTATVAQIVLRRDGTTETFGDCSLAVDALALLLRSRFAAVTDEGC